MEEAIVIGILVLVGLVACVAIWGMIMQWSVLIRYNKNNKRTAGDKTARQVAEAMLDKLGYTDITVQKTSWLWLLFFYKWGNRYSPRKKAIMLYGNIIDKNTVTAIAIATQKVGLVIQHKQGEKKMVFRAKHETWTRLAPNMFIPIITIGAVIDVLINFRDGEFNQSAFGYVTLVFAVLAIIYTIIAFVTLYLIIPTERRAGELAMEKIQQYNLIPEEHLNAVRALYKVQVRVYIADFIMALVNLILDILYVASKVASFKK